MKARTRLNSFTTFVGFGYNTNTNGTGHSYRFSKNTGCHPYLKADFWNNPSNQFWNSDLYSDQSKEYFNNSVNS